MIWILIYLSGCVVAYLLGKKLTKMISFEGRWKKSDRAFWLMIGTLSWMTALVTSMHLFANYNDDEDASW